ncbi:MAG TPA: class I SAM-dependent methyltransferase [Methanocellaceae archaeon]|jgi:ubiquinone/menaquinone biosynthesis C-methylase UbiE
MSLRGFLSKVEPEGIPFPLSRVYSLVTLSGIIKDFYSTVANQVLGHLGSGRVLDVGTGPGRLPLIIASKNKYIRVTGVDLSPDMVKIASKKAAKKGLENLDFKVGNASSLPFREGEFDLVISTLSFHHWKGPEAALEEIHRVLREGGEAWIFDMPRRMDAETLNYLKQRYGFMASYFLYLHGFTEPFYDEISLKEIAESSSFNRYELNYKGLAYRLKLFK